MKFIQQILPILLAAAALQSCATNPNQGMNVPPGPGVDSAAGVAQDQSYIYRGPAASPAQIRGAMAGAAGARGR
jgi:hypothetical protein